MHPFDPYDQHFESFEAPEAAQDAGAAGCGHEGDDARQLVLVKKGQRYLFRYQRGGEAQMLAHLVGLAQDEQSDMDWFDVAMLSHQMGQRMSSKLERMIK